MMYFVFEMLIDNLLAQSHVKILSSSLLISEDVSDEKLLVNIDMSANSVVSSANIILQNIITNFSQII